MAQEFDFVVVGGGTAGCLLAARLAASPAAPSVALLESGPAIDKPEYRRTFERFSTVFEHAHLDHGYVSTPQKHCGGREVPQTRGKGLGGSSAVNFQVWSLGARGEFERWREVVGDDDWGFENVIEKIRQLENLHTNDAKGELAEYTKPDPKYHGYSGPIDVSISNVEGETKFFLDAGVDLGYKKNLDPNDGDPIGFSLAPSTNLDGVRVTAASAFLEKNTPSSLSVIPDARIVKVLFEGTRAVGVLREDGSKILAKKEVILSAGAVDTPRLLLLSGVGPASDLQSHGISVVKDLDGVGKYFTDHSAVLSSYHMGPGFTKRQRTAAGYQDALKQLTEKSEGPLLEHFSSVPHAFLKNERAYESPEFAQLDKATQELLLRPDVPSYEIVTGPLVTPDHKFDSPDDGFCTMFVANMNSTSHGTVKLSSSNPQDKPLIDPNYLKNPYDVVNLHEALKESMGMMKTATMKSMYIQPLLAPKSQSNEDVEEFIRNNVSGLWHPSCSVKMGRTEEDGSCVTADLKIHGLQGLRVADLSVVPLLPSGHPQIVAYVIGQIASEKIAKEHGLSSV